MPKYYFDIETYPGVNPKDSKIISIQIQELDEETGKPIGDLVILKEWESSEEHIVRMFHSKFFTKKSTVWNFIPVGYYLDFEWNFLVEKFRQYLKKKGLSYYRLQNRPYLDLHTVGVLINFGKFKGSGLDNLTNRALDGEKVKEWYENKEFDKIEHHIREKNSAFLGFLQEVIRLLKGYDFKGQRYSDYLDLE